MGGGTLIGIGAVVVAGVAVAGTHVVATTWRGHPNAQVRLVRRASSAD